MRELVRVWAADQTFRSIFELLDTARHLIETDMVRSPGRTCCMQQTVQCCATLMIRHTWRTAPDCLGVSRSGDTITMFSTQGPANFVSTLLRVRKALHHARSISGPACTTSTQAAENRSIADHYLTCSCMLAGALQEVGHGFTF